MFWVQFLGAFNDNIFKNALVILITFRLSQSNGETGLLITLAVGLFILPFFLFSGLAGQLADHYPKSFLIQKIKLAEVFIMLLGSIALLNLQLELLFVTLFLMGTQSAFFGPIKYSVLPELLEAKNLMQGNALFSGSTFIAILLGTILGGVGVLMPNGTEVISIAIIGVALLGYGVSLLLQPSTIQNSELLIEANLFKSSWQLIALCKGYHTSFFAVLAISWFWFLGAVMLSQIPTLVKYDLLANEGVATAFLAVFSIGIALGSVLVTLIFKNNLDLKWHGLFLGLISILLVAMVWMIEQSAHFLFLYSKSASLLSFNEFITIWPLNTLLLLLLLIALLGGAYIVPLYTLLQTQTPAKVRARMVAVNNILNAFLMVLSAVLVMIGFALSISLLNILLFLAILNLIFALWLQVRQNKLKIV
jgi:acyl-[acyl-carrier-protein]-phospholipid O-acyltransferase/long-chain-fatty-acid--[acyl-carrier-protein] ligase